MNVPSLHFGSQPYNTPAGIFLLEPKVSSLEVHSVANSVQNLLGAWGNPKKSTAPSHTCGPSVEPVGRISSCGGLRGIELGLPQAANRSLHPDEGSPTLEPSMVDAQSEQSPKISPPFRRQGESRPGGCRPIRTLADESAPPILDMRLCPLSLPIAFIGLKPSHPTQFRP